MEAMDPADRLEAAIDAALAAGRAAGYEHARPEVLQRTNNVVVWLAPHPIVAKVGIRSNSRRLLQRESELCAELVALGSPVPTPWRDSPLHSEHGLRPGAGRYGDAELPVSLWRQVDTRGAAPTPIETATLLRRVHEDLARCDLTRLDEPLPSYLDALDGPEGADAAEFSEAGGGATTSVPLHGEPHSANVLATSRGPVLIDFEGACIGPVEWDLAIVAPEVAAAYAALPGDPVDLERLEVFRRLRAIQGAPSAG